MLNTCIYFIKAATRWGGWGTPRWAGTSKTPSCLGTENYGREILPVDSPRNIRRHVPTRLHLKYHFWVHWQSIKLKLPIDGSKFSQFKQDQMNFDPRVTLSVWQKLVRLFGNFSLFSQSQPLISVFWQWGVLLLSHNVPTGSIALAT